MAAIPPQSQSPILSTPVIMDEQVVKRNGQRETVDPGKITRRLQRLKTDAETFLKRKLDVSVWRIAQATIGQIYDGITTSELDEEAAEVSAYLTDHPDYADFAGQILTSNLEANNRDCLGFQACVEKAYAFVEERTGETNHLVSDELLAIARKYGHHIDRRIKMGRNYLYDYFAIQTLIKGQYLLSAYREIQKNKVTRRAMVPFETPQHMWMRVAIGIHGWNLDAAYELYDTMSLKFATMATPTLFNAGTARSQLSSCFLQMLKDDSLEGIYDTLKNTAIISKHAGGLGIHIHNLRSHGSYIKGTNGTSNGLVPMLKVFNNTARYCDQCFHPDTIVYTKNGPKPIGAIQFNDELVTLDGTFQKVLKVMHHPIEGKMWNVSTKQSIDSVQVTSKHPILCIPDQGTGANMSVLRRRLELCKIKPDFVEVDDLHVRDMIGYPIPKFEEDVSHLSEADCRMLGIMIGDGYICQNSKQIMGVSLHSLNKVATAEFVRQYLSNLVIHGTETKREDSQNLRIVWTQWQHFPITREMIYNSHGDKVVPSFALHLPKNKLKQVIVGILETDGCINGGNGTGEILLEMTSKHVIESVRYMLLRLGVLSSGYTRDRVGQTHELARGGSITCQKPSYVLRIPKAAVITTMLGISPGKWVNYFEWQGVLYSRITEMKQVDYQGMAIDFEMENNPSYLTHMGLAHNGGGKRKGSFAIYLEPWHADIFEFLDLKKPNGAEDERARDLFYALWVPDLFWKRVVEAYHQTDEEEEKSPVMWSLMDPNVSKGLSDVWGEEFEALYEQYEAEQKFTKQIPVKQLAEAIWTARIETGTPYILNKDHCNRKSNQKNLGTIKSSNLCVTGDTTILTQELGQVPIQEVVDQKLHVWNGEQWSETTVRKTNEAASLWKVTFNHGVDLHCTAYHKFFIQPDPQTSDQIVQLETQELQKGMKIPRFKLPDGTARSFMVTNVEVTDRVEPTYCFNEPLKHAGIFNGIMTGNCSEIVEYSSPTESSVCNLASVALPSFVDRETLTFDHQALYKTCRIMVRALNQVIDRNYYPVPEAERSNLRHRPVGLGIQGLADVFCYMRIRYGSPESQQLNRDIAETMYFAAMTESHAATQEIDPETKAPVGPYASIDENGGAPIRHGLFQFDLWADDFKNTDNPDGWKPNPALGWDWEGLRVKVMADGVRNSLLMAQMPTASTSQILGNLESFESYYGVMFVRRTKVGEFYQYCRPLIEDLVRLGLWRAEVHPETKKMYIPLKEKIKAANGSIQGLAEIPQELKDLYVTLQDISLKDFTTMARDRGVFTDQSMSLNVHFKNKNNMMPKLLKYDIYAWKLGLKTSSYYTRTIQDLAVLDFTGTHVKDTDECTSCGS